MVTYVACNYSRGVRNPGAGFRLVGRRGAPGCSEGRLHCPPLPMQDRNPLQIF